MSEEVKIDYLDSYEVQKEVLQNIADDNVGKEEWLVVQEGESPWKLITAVRNHSLDRTSLTHGMEVPGGVLVRVTDMKGNGGTAIALQFLTNVKLRKDKMDDDLWVIDHV